MSALFGHESAATPELSKALGLPISNSFNPEVEIAVFIINCQTGIDQQTIETWHQFDDYLTPRLLLVTGFADGDQDFDDAILIARRVLDEVATPFLVLHDEFGKPAGLINLVENEIIDYSNHETRPADPEHVTLVSEFRSEYLNQFESTGERGFEEGIFFPAIPIQLPDIGVDIAREYIERITKP